MAKRRRAARIRRSFPRARRSYRRAKGFGGGVLGDVITGAVIGAGVSFAAPHINRYVPSVMGLAPSTVALLGGGVAAKAIFHKGGKWADAAVVLGSAMAASQLMGSNGGSSGGSYLND